jgi:hypothetical protein
MPSALAMKKAKAVAACKDKRGRISPATLIEHARDPNHVCHNEFPWDDAEAARLHRLTIAARIIREVKFVVEYESVSLVAPVYVSDPSGIGSAYVETATIASSHVKARRVLDDELARIRGAIHRAMALAAVFGLISNFERMLDLAVETERTLVGGDGDDDGDYAPSAS